MNDVSMTRHRTAKLYIDDQPVGDVSIQRIGASWSHGKFYPYPGFAKFAGLFGQWSLMMHVDGRSERLSQAAGAELRRLEVALDRLHAKLHFPQADEWSTCAQLNIDGPLIEWKSV